VSNPTIFTSYRWSSPWLARKTGHEPYRLRRELW